MTHPIYSFLTAFAITYFLIPPIVRTALAKHLYDEPVARSSHAIPTPSLGGVGIFGGIFIALLLWTPHTSFANLQYLLVAIIIVFLTGVKDDLVPMSAKKKLLAQLLAAGIIVYVADIRLESFHGMLGWSNAMPYGLSLVLSVFTILVIMNAFNLIDGINGLGGGIGVVVFSTLGTWFYLTGSMPYATLAFAGAGAFLAFLRFNLIPPAQTFMGDTGSLVLGTIAAMLTLVFIEQNDLLPLDNPLRVSTAPVVAITIISIPLFDTLRVFSTRCLRGFSPFSPDRRHIHHLLIDSGRTHLTATSILVLANILVIALVFSLHPYLEPHLLLLLVIGLFAVPTYALHRAVLRRKKLLDLFHSPPTKPAKSLKKVFPSERVT
jgi:UDP-GlcNAc:undecaprenyl-phosphate/decaprenyl-phosphate GlcNAc-1-phosphate transferase